MQDDQGLGAQAAGHIVVLGRRHAVGSAPSARAPPSPPGHPAHREPRREGVLPTRVRVLIGVPGTAARWPRGEEPGLVQAQLLQLLGVLGQRGREEQLLQRHLRAAGAGRAQTLGRAWAWPPALLTQTNRPGAPPGQGRAGLSWGPVPGSGHDLGLPSLEQSEGVLGTLPREGCRHHPGEPGLVHAVYHPVSLVDDLQARRPGSGR